MEQQQYEEFCAAEQQQYEEFCAEKQQQYEERVRQGCPEQPGSPSHHTNENRQGHVFRRCEDLESILYIMNI